jgi:trehalose 6-phosphate synthase/phosphatase
MKFRDKIVEVYQERDLIWLHGFHLLMLPSFISKSLPTAKVSLFLHTPFPSSEIFRTLSVREDLLRGMLNADHIGFHLYEYARHFLTCVRRLLGLTYEMENGQLVIHYNGRNVAISCLHVGLDTSLLYRLIDTDPIRMRVEELQNEYRGKQVIVGVDRLERIRGLPLKLLMYERMLEKYPIMQGKVVLLQFGILAGETGEDFLRTRKEVLFLVTRINKKFVYDHPSWKPVTFTETEESKIRHPDRLPYFVLADVLLISSPRDGLNRLPMEFVAAHTKYRPENPGVTLLSEFVSCMRVLRGCLVLNPWKITQASELLHRALTLPLQEKIRRHKADAEYVSSHTTLHWAYQILTDLKAVRKDFDRRDMSSMGLGMGYRILGMEAGFQPLKIEAVVKTYRTARNRLILFDYGGTLVDNNEQKESLAYYAVSTKQEKREGPEKHVIQALVDLCSDPKNHVYVITGKDKSSLEEYFKEVPDLGIGAEHGFYVRRPKGTRWEAMIPSFDRTWMHLARNIMDVYSSRTHGTYIEQKESALIWQYREADPEFGQMQSKELEDHLAGVLRGYPVEVLHGENNPMQGGYVEVRPENMDKGVFLSDLLKRMEDSNAIPDMLLCMGDDASDEFMFNVVEEYVEKHPEKSKSYFACTVGKKPSTAQAFLNDTSEVHSLMSSLAKTSKLINRSHAGSSVNLRSLAMMANNNMEGNFGSSGNEVGNLGGGFGGLSNFGGGLGGLGGFSHAFSPLGQSNIITEEDSDFREDEGIDMDTDDVYPTASSSTTPSTVQSRRGSDVSMNVEFQGAGTSLSPGLDLFSSGIEQGGLHLPNGSSTLLTGNKRKLGATNRSFSMNDLSARDVNTKTPTSMTWSKWCQTIQEGNDEPMFF